jgi:hypothetical protein
MIEVDGVFWNSKEDYRAIPTNAMCKKNGNLIMGAGTALQASQRCPKLAKKLGEHVRIHGNIPAFIEEYMIVTFPSKQNWQYPSDIDLIEKSARYLQMALPEDKTCAITRVGCGNGALHWDTVKARIAPILDDRFRVYK